MPQSFYVNSGYERIKDDNYHTIDERCIKALSDCWELTGLIIDPCAPSGSGIVDGLFNLGYNVKGIDDAFSNFDCGWIVTNPPYERPIVDEIAQECLSKLRADKCNGVAMLMRGNWDFAASRAAYFRPPWYSAQIRMCFRPWWSEERKSAPIHNFVWHIWEKHDEADPIIKYWP